MQITFHSERAALGGSRRAALVGGSTASRLCYGRLAGGHNCRPGGSPVSITAASCNRAGLWRCSLSLERARHDGKVLVAEPLIDSLLPFVGQARKGGEAVVAGRL